MKKLVLSVLFIIASAFIITGCSNDKTWDQSSDVLIIGLECNYSPFNWTETSPSDTNVPIDGEEGLYAEGYDIQVAKRIAEELGVTLVVKAIVWEGLIESLKTGVIDAIIAGMSPTEERKESIAFTDHYYISDHVVVLKKDSQYASATTLADFAGAKICGQISTIYDALAEQLASGATGAVHQTPMKSVPLIVNAILEGTTDATIVERPVAMSLCAVNNELTYITLSEAFDVDEEDILISCGIRKSDTSLCELINNALATISESERASLMETAVEMSYAIN